MADSDEIRKRVMPADNSEPDSARMRENAPGAIPRADKMRLALIIVWQFFNMINMGVILSDWKGWRQETRSSRGWMIAGTIQTIATLVGLIACYRVWLQSNNKL
ncbi:hypothetical protein F66182_7441 [Fusarium sp. NRRL 66182]|nr:hypothetical protein F66182_7441 [Fusarium sp. NRRL 66182]